MEEAVLDTLLKNGLGLPSQPPELVHSMRKDPEHQVSPSKNSDKEHKRLAISWKGSIGLEDIVGVIGVGRRIGEDGGQEGKVQVL